MINLIPHDIKKFKLYCQKKTLYQISSSNNESKELCRGRYKGYLYGVKICNYLLKKRIYITSTKVYLQIKTQRNNIMYTSTKTGDYLKGLTQSLYDLENYLSSLE